MGLTAAEARGGEGGKGATAGRCDLPAVSAASTRLDPCCCQRLLRIVDLLGSDVAGLAVVVAVLVVAWLMWLWWWM